MQVVMVPGWQAKVRGPMLDLQHDIADQVAGDARQNIIDGGHVDTGDLLGSIRQEGTRVLIGTDHWHPIEYGAPAHVIRPNVKQALWWVGAEHPVGKVNHPGNRAYQPMRRALFKERG